jgi:benzodiazapine receptor
MQGLGINMSNVWKLIVSVVLTLGAGFFGSLATTPKISSWYSHINKPSFNPPNWIFGPVWTFIFILMGIAFYLIWKKGVASGEVKAAMVVFGLQLILNVLWSFLFFYFESPTFALADIAVLWLAILATIIGFWKIDIAAGVLLIPYLIWVSFAGILNAAIVQLNQKQ